MTTRIVCAYCGEEEHYASCPVVTVAAETKAEDVLLQVAILHRTFNSVSASCRTFSRELDRLMVIWDRCREVNPRPVPCPSEGDKAACERCWASHEDAVPYCANNYGRN